MSLGIIVMTDDVTINAGEVGGNVPRASPAFEQGPFIERPGPEIDLSDGWLAPYNSAKNIGQWLVDGHNLIASGSKENLRAREAMLRNLIE